jgi:hypothetical protein
MVMATTSAAPDGSLIVTRDGDGYASLVAGRAFTQGAVISPFGAQRVSDQPNYLTVQVAADQHIMLEPDYLQFTNHSCDPNAFFETEQGALLALRRIEPGEGITFFYPSTEWVMDRPFACHCGAANCLGHIAGASQLDRAVLSHYRLAAHIRAALAAE